MSITLQYTCRAIPNVKFISTIVFVFGRRKKKKIRKQSINLWDVPEWNYSTKNFYSIFMYKQSKKKSDGQWRQFDNINKIMLFQWSARNRKSNGIRNEWQINFIIIIIKSAREGQILFESYRTPQHDGEEGKWNMKAKRI